MTKTMNMTKKLLSLGIIFVLQTQISVAQDNTKLTNEKSSNATINNANNAATNKPNWDDNSQQLFDAMVSTFKINNNDFDDFDKNLAIALKANDNGLNTKVFFASLKLKRYQDTLKIIEHWKTDNKDIDFLKVYALALNGKIDDAYKLMDERIVKNGYSDDYISKYISVLSTSWDDKNILNLAEKLNENHPDLLTIRYFYLQLLNWQLDNAKAITVIDKLILKEPKNLKLYALKSDVYRNYGEANKAKQVWQSALTDYPNDSDFQMNYARFLFDSYDFTSCLTELDKIKSKAMQADVLDIKFIALVRLGKLDEAYKVYDLSKATNSEKNITYSKMAAALIQNKYYKEAGVYLDKIANADKGLASAVSMSKVNIAYNTSFEQGEIEFNKLADLYKDDEQSKTLDHVDLLVKSKLYKNALDLLTKQIKQQPKNSDYYYSRSLVNDYLGKIDDAISDLSVALNLKPNNVAVENALGYMLVNNNKDLAAADKLINSAFVDTPFDPAVVDSKGWYYYKKGEYARALPYLHYAYSNYIDGEVAGHYISALAKSGDIVSAKAIYNLELINLKNDDKLQTTIAPIKNLLN